MTTAPPNAEARGADKDGGRWFELLCRHKDLSFQHHKEAASLKRIAGRFELSARADKAEASRDPQNVLIYHE